jgi:hypothetical protein
MPVGHSRMTSRDSAVFERPYPFLELPAASLSAQDRRIRAVGLARLLPAPGFGRRRVAAAPTGCQLRRLAHAHVYSIGLDFNLVCGDSLNWPVELDALASTPDCATISGLQQRREALNPPTTLQVARGTVMSHRLVWTDGTAVPASVIFERCHVVLPVIGLIGRSADVARTLGYCLRNPDEDLDPFLWACVVAAQLKEQLALIDSAADAESRWALRALFGEVVHAPQTAPIVALGTVRR